MRKQLRRIPWLSLVVLLALPSGSALGLPEETPALVGPHAQLLALEKISGSLYSAASTSTQTRATQMAWGPGPDPGTTYLYVASNTHGVRRLEYDPVSGALSSLVDLLAVDGNGVAFHVDALGRDEMYLTNDYESANDADARLARLYRYVDVDADGVFGSGGDASAAIVHGVPRDGHTLNQLQTRGDALYAGCGVRTENGALDSFVGDTFGESAYGGTILVIDDLDQVATSANAAGFAAYGSDPTSSQYEDVIDGTTAGAEQPFTSTSAGKLRVHSSGTRNPFGIAFDGAGDLYFTVNFHRVNNSVYDRSITGAGAEPDDFDGPANDDVHDQMFRAVAFADYGYRNGNWQGDVAAQAAGFFAGVGDPTLIAPTLGFDNLDQDGPGGPDFDSLDPAFDVLHDPANPIGLGPHAALTGLAFNGTSFASPRYHGRAFVARFNGLFGILDGLDYRDVVLVDVQSGEMERVVSGFNGPTDVLADANGNLLVADYFGSIWRIRSTQTVPAASGATQALLALLLLLASAGAIRMRRTALDPSSR